MVDGDAGDAGRIGVLLLGGNNTHQENYARAFAADTRCRLTAVADEADAPPERHRLNQALADELDLPYLRVGSFGSPELRALGSSVASVCVEHERRARVAVECAREGLHLYLDKPSACSVPGARAIAEAAESAGVVSQMFSFIHTPWAEAAREVVRSGELGAVRSVHVEVLFAKGRPGTADRSLRRVQPPFPQRFTFPDAKRELRATGVYGVTLALWLLGGSVEWVSAQTANYFFREHQEAGAEDFGVLAMGISEGRAATVTAGRIGAASHARGGPLRVTLVGESGLVTVDANRPRVEVCALEEPWRLAEPDPQDPMSFWRSTQLRTPGPSKRGWLLSRGEGEAPLDARRFVDCVLSRTRPEVDARVASAAVETLMTAYVSAAQGGARVRPSEVEWPHPG